MRTPTTAHPWCVCGKWKRSYSTHDWVVIFEGETPVRMEWRWVEKRETFDRSECPMHRPAVREGGKP